MSTVKSSSADLTLNADGSGNDIILQSNASQVGSLTAEGVLTATSFAGSGASLTGLTSSQMPTGSVLQVVSATLSTETSSASRSWVTTGLDAAITPSSTSNKIFIYFNVPCYAIAAGEYMWVTLFRGTVSGTNLGDSSYGFQNIRGGDATIMGPASGGYLDSPSTTSSQTYTVGFYSDSGTPRICNNDTMATITLMEIAG